MNNNIHVPTNLDYYNRQKAWTHDTVAVVTAPYDTSHQKDKVYTDVPDKITTETDFVMDDIQTDDIPVKDNVLVEDNTPVKDNLLVEDNAFVANKPSTEDFANNTSVENVANISNNNSIHDIFNVFYRIFFIAGQFAVLFWQSVYDKSFTISRHGLSILAIYFDTLRKICVFLKFLIEENKSVEPTRLDDDTIRRLSQT